MHLRAYHFSSFQDPLTVGKGDGAGGREGRGGAGRGGEGIVSFLLTQKTKPGGQTQPSYGPEQLRLPSGLSQVRRQVPKT